MLQPLARTGMRLVAGLLLVAGAGGASSGRAQETATSRKEVSAVRETPSPAYRDPITDGVADPCMVWNREEKCWWMLYTQRRANVESAGVAYCYGTKIAIASTPDKGKTWVYRGTLPLEWEKGENTFWAPAVVYHEGVYHLFVTYIPGIRTNWGGTAKVHAYTSKDLWTWEHKGLVPLGADGPIDPTVLKLGTPERPVWRMWHKTDGAHTAMAESTDLEHWTPSEKSGITDRRHEGPIAFKLGGWYWLIVDQWAGMAIYRSKDAESWAFANVILSGASKRREDTPSGAHGDVIVDESPEGDAAGKAWIYYFTHPGRKKHSEDPAGPNGVIPFDLRRSSMCVAALRVKEGEKGPELVEERDGLEVALPDLR